MTGRYSNPLKLDKEMNIQDIAEYYSNRLIKEENRSKALILREISNDIQFEDRKGTIYDLKGIWYKPWQYDQLMFIAAHIIDVNQYRKHFFIYYANMKILALSIRDVLLCRRIDISKHMKTM